MKIYRAEDAPRTHVPEMEKNCWNQMPKTRWRELKLYRFDGTELYQWFGKIGADLRDPKWSVFEESATDVFRMREL